MAQEASEVMEEWEVLSSEPGSQAAAQMTDDPGLPQDAAPLEPAAPASEVPSLQQQAEGLDLGLPLGLFVGSAGGCAASTERGVSPAPPAPAPPDSLVDSPHGSSLGCGDLFVGASDSSLIQLLPEQLSQQGTLAMGQHLGQHFPASSEASFEASECDWEDAGQEEQEVAEEGQGTGPGNESNLREGSPSVDGAPAPPPALGQPGPKAASASSLSDSMQSTGSMQLKLVRTDEHESLQAALRAMERRATHRERQLALARAQLAASGRECNALRRVAFLACSFCAVVGLKAMLGQGEAASGQKPKPPPPGNSLSKPAPGCDQCQGQPPHHLRGPATQMRGPPPLPMAAIIAPACFPFDAPAGSQPAMIVELEPLAEL